MSPTEIIIVALYAVLLFGMMYTFGKRQYHRGWHDGFNQCEQVFTNDLPWNATPDYLETWLELRRAEVAVADEAERYLADL